MVDVILKLADGRLVSVTRDDKKNVILEHDGIEVKLPKASGRTTLDIITLLNTLEEQDEEEI